MSLLSSDACVMNFSDVNNCLSCDVINAQNLSRSTSAHAPLAAILTMNREAARASVRNGSCVALLLALSTSARRRGASGDVTAMLSLPNVCHMLLA